MSLLSLLKKKWKHMWISHSIPFSASHSQSLGKRKAVLRHRWYSMKRQDLIIWSCLCRMDSYWALLTTTGQDKQAEKSVQLSLTCMKWTKTTEITQILQSFLMIIESSWCRIQNPWFECLQIRDLAKRGSAGKERFSSWHTLSSQCYSVTEAWISNVHRMLQAL